MKTKIFFIVVLLALAFSIGMNISQHNQKKAFEKAKEYIISDISYCNMQIPEYEQKVQKNKDRMKEYAKGSYAYEAFQKEASRYQKFANELSDFRGKRIESLINLKN